MNTENLLKMADLVEKIPEEKFCMREYKTECGSIGCVLGYCTTLDMAGFMACADAEDPYGTWSEKFTGLDGSSQEWMYMFASYWYWTDNTPQGAAARIRYVVKNGIPVDWYAQMMYGIPLSYENPLVYVNETS